MFISGQRESISSACKVMPSRKNTLMYVVSVFDSQTQTDDLATLQTCSCLSRCGTSSSSCLKYTIVTRTKETNCISPGSLFRNSTAGPMELWHSKCTGSSHQNIHSIGDSTCVGSVTCASRLLLTLTWYMLPFRSKSPHETNDYQFQIAWHSLSRCLSVTR